MANFTWLIRIVSAEKHNETMKLNESHKVNGTINAELSSADEQM